MPGLSNEPSLETYAAVGRMCVAWSYVEMQSEKILWGLLDLNQAQATEFVWRMQLPQRWQAIIRVARSKLPVAEVEELKAIKKLVDATQRDRNVVVHGIVHASLSSPAGTGYGDAIAPMGSALPFERVPCWTIFIGDDAGKSFPISTSAVDLINENMTTIQKLIVEFNKRKGFTGGTPLSETVEQDWPKRL